MPSHTTTPATARPSPLWRRWLQACASGIVAFGLALVLLPAPMQRVFNWIAFATPASPASFSGEAVAYITFVSAVLGAVMAGWGATMLWVVAGPFRRGERAGWWMLAAPLALWFAADTAASLAGGFWRNAVFNAGLLMMFALPLAATWRGFFRC